MIGSPGKASLGWHVDDYDFNWKATHWILNDFQGARVTCHMRGWIITAAGIQKTRAIISTPN